MGEGELEKIKKKEIEPDEEPPAWYIGGLKGRVNNKDEQFPDDELDQCEDKLCLRWNINPIDSFADEEGGNWKQGAIKCKLWHLKKSTIIALGTIYKIDGKQMLHNKELPKDCYKVSIDKSLVDAACIPDEAEYVGLKEAEYAGLNQAKYDRLIPSEICIQAEYDICQAKYDSCPNCLKISSYAGSDTRTTNAMIEKTLNLGNQRIRLYCLGKDNGENIMESITEGPFKMGTFIQTPAEEIEGALQLGPERARVFTNLSTKEKERGLKESNFDQLYAYLKQHEVHASENRMMMERFIQPTNDPLALVSNASVQQKPISENNARGNVVAGNAGGQNRGAMIQTTSRTRCYLCKPRRMVQYWMKNSVVSLQRRQYQLDDDLDDQPRTICTTSGSYLEADQHECIRTL
ncbi:hypothetical protein Tco_1532259 [Tanacetum coccineum]